MVAPLIELGWKPSDFADCTEEELIIWNIILSNYKLLKDGQSIMDIPLKDRPELGDLKNKYMDLKEKLYGKI